MARTRQWLRDALIQLIHERDYEKITVQDIAERAAVNRATFYLHYRDKLDLLEKSVEEMMEALEASLLETFDNQARTDEPHPTFIRLFEQIAANGVFYRVLLTEKSLPLLSRKLTEVVTAFVGRGLIFMLEESQLAVSREIVLRYTAAAFLGVITWWLENDMPYTPKYMAGQLMRMATVGPYETNPFGQA